jgi:PTH2 family peptidyl-tRNA hydrolase
MASNTQVISACVLSFATGVVFANYLPFGTHPKKSRKASKKNSGTPSPTTPGSATSEDSEVGYSSDLEESEEEDFQVDSSTLNEIPGETRMALIVRTDLGMTKGKAAAQCAHAALGCYRLMQTDGAESQNLAMLRRWERSGQAKITLQVKSKEEMDLLFAKAISLNINSYIVHDAGRTQIEAGSATVLGLGPAPKMVLDEVTGELKLY